MSTAEILMRLRRRELAYAIVGDQENQHRIQTYIEAVEALA